jgi:F0F1-type ATP synthase alpha subunit
VSGGDRRGRMMYTRLTSATLTDNIRSLVDHSIQLDPQLCAAGMWPPINVATGDTQSATRFQPSLTRELYNATTHALTESRRRGVDADWAASFGLSVEDESLESLETLDYRRKLQLLLSQRRDECHTFADQLVTLHACASDVLMDVPLCDVVRYVDALRRHVYDDTHLHTTVIRPLTCARPSDALSATVTQTLADACRRYQRQYVRDHVL